MGLMPPAQAPQQGLMADAAAQPSPKSFFQRMLGNVFPTDPSLSGIISPEETAHNRRTALIQAGLSMMKSSQASDPWHPGATTIGALATGGQTGLGAYDQANAQSVQAHQLGQQQAMYQKQLAARQAIAQKYAAPPGESLQAEAQRLDNMGADYANAGMIPEADATAKMAAALHTRLMFGGAAGIKDTSQGYMRLDPSTGQMVPLIGQDGKPLTSNAPTEADRVAQRGQVASGRQQASEISEANGFKSTYKTLTDNATALTKAQTTLGQLDAKNPAALHSLAGVMASLEPMKPQLRAQMVPYLANVDPSVRGNILAWFDSKGTATLPPEQIGYAKQALAASAQALHDRYQGGFTQLSPGAQKRLASQSPDVLFKPLPPRQAPAAIAGSAVAPPKAYSPNNPFAGQQ